MNAPPSETVATALRIQALLAQARVQRTSAPALGAQAASEAVELARALGQPSTLAHALSMHSCCLRHGSELVPAAQTAQEAVALFANLPEPRADDHARAHSTAHVNHGIALTMLGRTGDALQAFEAARAISHAAGDAIGEADALLDTAVVANMLGEDAKAVALYQEVLPIYWRLGDDYHRACTLNNLAYAQVCWGTRLVAAGDHAAAQDHFAQAVAGVEAALPLARQSDHPSFVVSCLDTLAAAQRELGQWSEALATLQRQLAITRTLTGRRMEAVSLGSLGEVLRRSGQLAEAVAVLEQADSLFCQLQLAEQHASTLASLVDTYEARGLLADALAAHRRFHALQDRLRADAAKQKLHTLEARLKLERSEAELATQRQRSQELAALNARLLAVGHERETLVEELRRLSGEDALTGLANRRSFDSRLALEVERALRYRRPLSLVLLDLDHFKQINDQGSHALGDQVLRTIAQLLRAQTRPSDLVARLGGDEMVLLLPDTGVHEALVLCHQLGRRVAGFDWPQMMPLLVPTLSIGVAGLPEAAAQAGPRGAAGNAAAQAAAEAQAMLAAADVQLYRAKAQGRNRVCSALGDAPFEPLFRAD
jgi:diguanylate cyclase (GGDEF)-like protein